MSTHDFHFLQAMVSRANLVAAEAPEPKFSELESAFIGAGSAVAMFGLVVVALVVSKKYVAAAAAAAAIVTNR